MLQRAVMFSGRYPRNREVGLPGALVWRFVSYSLLVARRLLSEWIHIIRSERASIL